MKLQEFSFLITRSVMVVASVALVTAAEGSAYAAPKVDVKEMSAKEVREKVGSFITDNGGDKNVKIIADALFDITKGESLQMGIGNNIGINRDLTTKVSKGQERLTFVATTRDFVEAFEKIMKLPPAQRKAALNEVAGATDALQKKSGSLTSLDRQFIATQLILVGNSRATGSYNPRLANKIMTGQVKGEEAYTESGMRNALEVLSIAAYLAKHSNGAIDDGKAIDEAVEKYAATRTEEERNKMKECMGHPLPN